MGGIVNDMVIMALSALAVVTCAALIYDLLKGKRRPRQSGTYVGDAANQLRHVMKADFEKKRLMSKAEYAVFRTIEQHLRNQHGAYRILCQTSLGEVIGTADPLAFRSINSKRVDMLLLGPAGYAVAAIEYQGGEHYQGDAAARDAVKREALRKAGIEFIEIGAHEDVDGIQRVISASILRSTNPGSLTRPPNVRAVHQLG